MKWKAKQVGDVRIIRRFPLLPILAPGDNSFVINGGDNYLVWLEWVYVKQKWHERSHPSHKVPDRFWLDLHTVSKDEWLEFKNSKK